MLGNDEQLYRLFHGLYAKLRVGQRRVILLGFCNYEWIDSRSAVVGVSQWNHPFLQGGHGRIRIVHRGVL